MDNSKETWSAVWRLGTLPAGTKASYLTIMLRGTAQVAWVMNWLLWFIFHLFGVIFDIVWCCFIITEPQTQSNISKGNIRANLHSNSNIFAVEKGQVQRAAVPVE